MRSERPSMRYVEYRRNCNRWFMLVGFVVMLLLAGWVFVPTVVLAVLGLAVLGGAIACSLKIHDLRVQRRANDAAQAIDRRLERERWVVATEHETEVAPLGADPEHCDDCRITRRRREQASIHELATTLGEECTCDACANRPWRLRGSCHHPTEYLDPAYELRNEDNVIVHVDAFCRACGYTIKSDDDVKQDAVDQASTAQAWEREIRRRYYGR